MQSVKQTHDSFTGRGGWGRRPRWYPGSPGPATPATPPLAPVNVRVSRPPLTGESLDRGSGPGFGPRWPGRVERPDFPRSTMEREIVGLPRRSRFAGVVRIKSREARGATTLRVERGGAGAP